MISTPNGYLTFYTMDQEQRENEAVERIPVGIIGATQWWLAMLPVRPVA
jgi:hypothetical protein